jgi:hypothetical protein
MIFLPPAAFSGAALLPADYMEATDFSSFEVLQDYNAQSNY